MSTKETIFYDDAFHFYKDCLDTEAVLLERHGRDASFESSNGKPLMYVSPCLFGKRYDVTPELKSCLKWPPYKEPKLLDLEKACRFERLCLRALAEGIIKIEKASELLNVPIERVESMFNGLDP